MNSLLWGTVKSSKVFLSMKEHYFIGKLQESKILSRSGKKIAITFGTLHHKGSLLPVMHCLSSTRK
jgi:hypothetical protein